VAITHAGDNLLEVTNVAGVLALEKILPYCRIDLALLLIGPKLPQEVMGERQDILGTLPKWRELAGPTSDTILKVASKPAQ
jgi:hypothetical protein